MGHIILSTTSVCMGSIRIHWNVLWVISTVGFFFFIFYFFKYFCQFSQTLAIKAAERMSFQNCLIIEILHCVLPRSTFVSRAISKNMCAQIFDMGTDYISLIIERLQLCQQGAQCQLLITHFIMPRICIANIRSAFQGYFLLWWVSILKTLKPGPYGHSVNDISKFVIVNKNLLHFDSTITEMCSWCSN